MKVLQNVEPQIVFSFFEEISSIPHGSGNTDAISEYLVEFAEKRKLEYHKDKINNVIIIKEATKGYENSEPIILQSHMDMVCEKDADSSADMSKDAISLNVSGDLISANGTTLGADNGIGMALTLAALSDETLSHPKIEAVFTVDEEIGMLGAFDIDVSLLSSRRMLNLDSGCESVFTVSCAGGITIKSSFLLNREDFCGQALKITLSGLSGGHSGVMIGNGGANSNSLYGRIFSVLSKVCDFRIADIRGGFKDNAIPVETSAVIVCNNPDACVSALNDLCKTLKNEYSSTDSGLCISTENLDYQMPFDKESCKKIKLFLTIAPNGVQMMSQEIKGLVQTSLNFAITNCTDTGFEATISTRSSVDSQKYMIAEKIAELTQYLGGSVETWGDYPGWEFKKESPLRKLMTNVFKKHFSKEPVVEAVHAGLECGLFSGRINGLDCVSYGPDMWDVHTPRERLSISSVQRVWLLLKDVLSSK